MSPLTFGVWFSCLLSLSSLVTSAPNYSSGSKCVGSPVDLLLSLVGGRATRTLPEALMSLKLTVQARRLERNGAKILRLYPVMADEKKCIIEMHNMVHMCYEFSEIHWGKTDEDGSDHIIFGHRYPMEIQHYFQRTNTTHSIIGLAVGVLVKIDELPRHNVSSESPSTGAEQRLGNRSAEFQLRDQLKLFSPRTILSKEENMRLSIGSLLPKDFKERRFFQYRGSLSGACTDTRDWVVFEEPIIVPYLFLEALRSLSTSDYPNHFVTYQEHRCLLHSHYPSDVNTCDAILTVTVGRNSSNIYERLNFVDGVREPMERTEIKTPLDSTGTEISQTEQSSGSSSGSRLSVSPSSDWNSSPKIAGNRNERSETNDSAKVSTTVSSAPVSTETSSLSRNPSEIAPNATVLASNTSHSVNPSHVQTTRSSTTSVPAGQGEVPSQTVNSTVVVQPSVQTSVVASTVVPSESPVLISEKNKSRTSVVVITGQGNAFRPTGDLRPSGKPETRDGSGEPELVTSRDSIQEIRKGNSSGHPPVSPSVPASVLSLKPGLTVVLLSIFMLCF